MNTKQAIDLLKAGNARFVSGALTPKDNYATLREQLSTGQHPFAVVLCCSDSRVAPEIIFDQKLGDLFVIRNAGNIVDEEVLGSIEYAVEHLETPLVVVMGHSACGAVTATCQGGDLPGHIIDLAKRIKSYIMLMPKSLQLSTISKAEKWNGCNEVFLIFAAQSRNN